MNRRLRLTLCVAVVVLIALVAGGGVASASPIADTTPTSAPASGTVYIVRSGDSLGRIAARFGVSMSALARANGISNPNFIYIGQRLTIPGPGSSSSGSAATSPAPAASGSYVVRRGDTLASIAARYGTSVAALVRANGLANANVIYIGQRLRISGSASSGGSSSGSTGSTTPAPASAGRWIDVNVTTQRVTAYEGNRAVFSAAASTGLPRTPTVLGTFRVYVKYPSTTMTGPGYYLPGVPYTMYFYKGYALHGAYWHNNFGHPMSHGCVNLSIPDSRWLYNFASVGTLVKVHR